MCAEVSFIRGEPQFKCEASVAGGNVGSHVKVLKMKEYSFCLLEHVAIHKKRVLEKVGL